jgi:hypothetical protein
LAGLFHKSLIYPLLGKQHAVEDGGQESFPALLQQGRWIGKPNLSAGWLPDVASRMACRLHLEKTP